MKFNKTVSGLAPYILIVVVTFETLVLGLNKHLIAFYIGVALLVISVIALIIYNYTRQQRTAEFLREIETQLAPGQRTVTDINIPIVAVTDRRISWYNDSFRRNIASGHDCVGASPDFLLSDDIIETGYSGGTDIEYNGKTYRVYISKYSEDTALAYFVDRSDAVEYKEKFESGKPVAVYISVDNIDELLRGTRDSEAAQISGSVEKRIENWAVEIKAVCRKVNQDRYLLVTDESGLTYMRDTRFDILEKVKTVDFGEKGRATLSIGVGHGGQSFSACEEYARQALDMALGRGGDQAAVKDSKDFEFFGGTSSAGSKRSKVRTRMVATALNELISNCDNVLVMGHRFADFDSFGSCYGIYRAVLNAGKSARIVMRRDRCLCGPLSDYITASYPDEQIIVSPEDAAGLIGKGTLLIVTDTHRPSFLESPELFESAPAVAVIDHHRKTVDYIDNAVIFYHEPYASSACEMVSELIQYMSVDIGKVEAEALLTGIALDTRNFVLNTGVRTFEASAYLRSCGASTVTVKEMFKNSIDVYMERSSIVKNAQVYGDCAISYTENQGGHVRVAASQAADDMLGIEDINASFVLFVTGTTVNISARSLGKTNVQLIMETLGGGGHFTMSACQIENCTVDTAMVMLKGAIDKYRSENNMSN